MMEGMDMGNKKKNRKRTADKTRKVGDGTAVKTGKLTQWQNRLLQSNSDSVWSQEVSRMDKREQMYKGDRKLRPVVKADKQDDKTPHVRNIVFENIESCVSSSIPQPKVTPLRQQDEHLAEIIENFLRLELNRQPFERMNDMAERTIPIQGGGLWLGEWDESKRTHSTRGAIQTSLLHPKQLAPQPGVFTGLNEMDWFILKVPTTRETIRRKYGVNVYSEYESEPEIRGIGMTGTADDALTQYIGFEKNDNGGINRYSWVNDIELEDKENYHARRQPVCKHCGRVRPLPGQILSNGVQQRGNLLPDPGMGFAGGLIEDPAQQVAGYQMAQQMAENFLQPSEDDSMLLGGMNVAAQEPERKYDNGACPWCGGNEWESREMEYEQVMIPIHTAAGKEIPGEYMGVDDMGAPALVPTMVPFYVPDIYPVILQRNVSVFGQLLGNSDVDAIEDQQNTINRLEKKIINRMIKAGTRITLPNKPNLRTDPEDGERWFLNNAMELSMIKVLEFTGNIQNELNYLSYVYEESRQILGITDSLQGRKDPTATSGKAKEFSASVAAGRQESKRVMKQAAYAELFELMFKYFLAYADEPRTVTYKDHNGDSVYEELNRYDFLEKDSNGQWYWNDQFLFSCDTAGPLASNREAMWQETRMNLQSGAFGNPQDTATLVLFWTKMEMLHYPGAGQTKKYLEEKLKREQAQAQAQAMQQQQIQKAQLQAQAAAAQQMQSQTGVA